MASTLISTNSCCNPCGDTEISIVSAIGMSSGSGTPEGNVTGALLGQIYTDSATGVLYVFLGTANTRVGWLAITEVNIVAFGAVSGANSTTAIQAAINAVYALGGGIVPIPEGDWWHTGLTLRSGVNLIGVGSGRVGQGGVSILRYTGTGIAIQGNGAVVFSAGLRHLAIRGTDTNGGTGLLLDSFQYAWIEDVHIDRFRNAGDTGCGLRMLNTHADCAFNRFIGLTVENSDIAIELDSTNGGNATGYNYFAGTTIYQEQHCLRLLVGAGNGGIYNVLNGLTIQGATGATGDYIYIEGVNNTITGIVIDAPQTGNILEFALTTTSGNNVQFIGGFDITKYVNAQTTGAANTVFYDGYITHAPGKPFQVLDQIGQLESSWQAAGNNAVEMHFGNAGAGTQAWRLVLQASATPTFSINKSGVGAIQRWSGNLIEMLFNLQLSNNLLMPNSSGIFFASSTAVLESVLGLTAGNILQLFSPTQGGGIQIIGRHAASTIDMLPGGSLNAASFDGSVAASETRMLLYDVTAGALVRVTRGAADSGGVGFRLLRIPN